LGVVVAPRLREITRSLARDGVFAGGDAQRRLEDLWQRVGEYLEGVVRVSELGRGRSHLRELGKWLRDNVGEVEELLGEGHWRVGQVGEVQRGTKIPCMARFQLRRGAKMEAEQQMRIGTIMLDFHPGVR